MDWIDLDYCEGGNEHWGSLNGGNFLIRWGPVIFSRRTLLCVVSFSFFFYLVQLVALKSSLCWIHWGDGISATTVSKWAGNSFAARLQTWSTHFLFWFQWIIGTYYTFCLRRRHNRERDSTPQAKIFTILSFLYLASPLWQSLKLHKHLV